jgi:site-specific recombinase XerC
VDRELRGPDLARVLGDDAEYRRPIEAHAIARWKTWRMNEVEPADLRDLFGQMRRDGRTTSEIKKTRAALSVMFATALEDGVVQLNPVLGVRIPPPSEDEKPPTTTRPRPSREPT